MACGSDGVTPPSFNVDRIELTVTPVRAFYPVNDTARVHAALFDEDGAPVSSSHLILRSLDPAVASVNDVFLVTMLGRGTARIQAEVQGKTARITLLVSGLLHSAAILKSETWQVADSPHVVQGNLQVGSPDTAVITIQPGTRVLFRSGAGLEFGEAGFPGPGRLITPGGAAILMEGDIPGTAAWTALTFHGPGRTELRDVTLRHCGEQVPVRGRQGCLIANAGPPERAPELLLENVTITGAPVVGMTLDNFVTIAPGSRNLSITNGDGHIATISPVIAGMLPLGGRFEGHPDNTIWIATGGITSSTTWVQPGVPWRLVGQVYVYDPSSPVLTIPAGTHILANPPGSLEIATLGRGSLVMGDATGPPVVIEGTSAGWGGIAIGDGALSSSLTRVELSHCGPANGACLRVDGGSGPHTVRMQDVTIRDAPGNGIQLTALARFDPASANLTISGSAGFPIEMPADAVASLPPGSYGQNGIDAIRLRIGGVTHTASWRNPGVPYWAPFGLSIGGDEDPILTLQPGVVLRMGPDTRVSIGGVLKAIGTAAAPVRFVSETPGIPGSWIGVELELTGDARTRLDHVTIEDAGAGEAGVTGAVRLQHDPGGLLRNTVILRSPTCGVMLFAGPWAEDYTNPLFGNTFIGVAGPLRCLLVP